MVSDHIRPLRLLKNEQEKGTLYQATVSLLRGHVNLSQVSRDLGIEYSWLQRLTYGKRLTNDTTRVQKIYEYLSGESL